MESVVEWQTNATRDENNMGDHIDLPFDLYEGVEALEERVMVQSSYPTGQVGN
jgi:hypothetical protein